jgi:probable rRNA maturation factor
MIEIEVFGARLHGAALTPAEVTRLCMLAAGSVGVREGHLAVEFVDPERIARLNREYRGSPKPTDVLSFPIDGLERSIDESERSIDESVARAPQQPNNTASAEGRQAQPVPCELGDVLICPAHTTDLREAVIHGVLHLLGMDHERDNGEMLALQAELLGSRGS